MHPRNAAQVKQDWQIRGDSILSTYHFCNCQCNLEGCIEQHLRVDSSMREGQRKIFKRAHDDIVILRTFKFKSRSERARIVRAKTCWRLLSIQQLKPPLHPDKGYSKINREQNSIQFMNVRFKNLLKLFYMGGAFI